MYDEPPKLSPQIVVVGGRVPSNGTKSFRVYLCPWYLKMTTRHSKTQEQPSTKRLASAIAGLSVKAKQALQQRFPLTFFCALAAAVLDGATGELMEYRHLIRHPKYKQPWKYLFVNEVGCLTQCIPGRSNGIDTIHFINNSRKTDKK